MKTVRKLLAIIVLAVIVLVIALGVLVSLLGGRAVKLAINKGASRALSVKVAVADVDLSILSGSLSLHGLSVGNPPGYKHENLLELETGSVDVELGSLLSDTVEINRLALDGAQVVLEQKDLVRNNVRDLIKALPKAPESEKDIEGKKLHIRELVISNTTVKVKLLSAPTVPLKLATIKMTDLGGDNKLDTPTLVAKVLAAIAQGIAEQGAGVLPDELIGGLSATLNKTLELGTETIKQGADLAEKVLKGTQKTGGKILDDAGDLGKQIGDALKGLKPGKKDQE